MDWLTFIATVVEHLAWPGVVALLLFLNRHHVSSMVRRLDELTLPGGTKARFGAGLAQVTDRMEQVHLATPALPKPRYQNDEDYLRLAAEHPAAAILQAYHEILGATRTYADEYPKASRKSESQIIKSLHADGYLPDDALKLFHSLRNLRNIAVHTADFDIAEGEALEYRRLSKLLADQVTSALAEFIKFHKSGLRERSENAEQLVPPTGG